MRYLSVCSGIEAATQAWHPLGWQPVAFSEIEKFPSAVLAHHYPDVPNWGDMTRFKEWPDEQIDLLVGGTPCQSFSVAGLRAGLDDPRGNLALTFCAIAEKYRPRWVVWENVPGVLSSERGRAFGAILGALAELGYSCAYRILDAQYVRTRRFPRAVPQRRRRVFVVAHLGDWRRAAAVLFDAESLRGNPPPGREAGEEAAARSRDCAEIGGAEGEAGREAEPARALAFDMRGREGGAMPEGPHQTANIRAASGGSSRSYVAHSLRGEGFDASEDGTGRGTPLVPSPVAPAVTSNPYGDHESREGLLVPSVANPLTHRMHKGINTTLDEGQAPIPVAFSCKDHGADCGETSPTLRAMGHGDSHANAGGQVAVAFHNRQDPDISGEVTSPLGSMDNGMAVAFKPGQSEAAGGTFVTEGFAPTLQGQNNGSTAVPAVAFSCKDHGADSGETSPTLRAMGHDGSEAQPAHAGLAVRRLTVEECEFLMGFPRGFTKIPWRNKAPEACPDGPRYKALGNSMAVNCMEFIGRKIQEQELLS